MLIKLTEVNSGNDLYLNHQAISAVFPAEKSFQEKYGMQTRVYITGEPEPWYVKETIEEVAASIRDADFEARQIIAYQGQDF